MNAMNLFYAAAARLDPLVDAGVAVLLFLAAICWRFWLRAARRRARRPLALIVSDAIAAGSALESPGSAAQSSGDIGREQAATRPGELVLGGLEKWNAGGNQWCFSIAKASKVIAIFCYPGKTEARAAHKAMSRVLEDLRSVVLPEEHAPSPQSDPASGIDLRRHRSIWVDRPETAAPGKI